MEIVIEKAVGSITNQLVSIFFFFFCRFSAHRTRVRVKFLDGLNKTKDLTNIEIYIHRKVLLFQE